MACKIKQFIKKNENMFRSDGYRENYICLIIGVFAACIFYINLKKEWFNMSYAADYLLYMMQGKDIFSGNYFLTDWIVSTNSYYSLSIIYGVFGRIFGYNIFLIAKVTSIIYGIIFFLMCKILYKARENKHSILALALYVLMIILINGYNDGQIMFAGSHQDVTIAGLVVILFLIRDDCNKSIIESIIKSFLLVLLLGIEIFSDQLTLAYIITPLLLFGAIRLFRKEYKNGLNIIVISLVSLCIGKFIEVLFSINNGLSLQDGASKTSICDTNTIIENLGLFLREILICFGGDIFEKELTLQNIIYFINAFVLILCMFIFKNQFSKYKNNLLIIFLSCQLFVITMMYILLYYPLHIGGVYYAIRISGVLLTDLALLFGIVICNSRMNLEKVIVIGCAVVTMINGLNMVLNPTNQDWYAKPELYQQISDDLRERNLVHGYASYYETFPITVTSEYAVELRAIMGPELSRFVALNKKSNDWEYADFILVNNDSNLRFGITEDALYSTIGEPKEKINYNDGEFTLYIWDKDIIPYINGIKD